MGQRPWGGSDCEGASNVVSEWRALRAGESAVDRRRLLEHAHQTVVGDGIEDPEQLARLAADVRLRPVVLESWLRAHRSTLSPDTRLEHPALAADELAAVRSAHPIGRALPVVQRLLHDEASDSGLIVAVGDAAGRLLWVDGDHRIRSLAEDIGFTAGMDWSEQAVGTCAPGSALELDHAIQVLGAEHFNRAVHAWSCTAAPVHDPSSGAIIGLIDVTGGDAAASPHILPLVQATLAAVEAELMLATLRDRMRQDERSRTVATGQVKRATAQLAPRLVVLGREPAVIEAAGRAVPVAGRHAEILLALALAPQGLNAAALAEQVYGDAAAEPTLRPEIVRMRKWLEHEDIGITVTSRPYRVSPGIRIDALDTLEALTRGAHRLALAAYEGPVLPHSEAPAVARLRADVDATLRESMLQSAAAEPLFDYAQNWGSEDVYVWETLLRVLPPLSPKRARVVAHLERIAPEAG